MTARLAKSRRAARRKPRRATKAAAAPVAEAREPEELNPSLAGVEDARRGEADDASVEDPLGDWPEPDMDADEWTRERGGRRSEEGSD